MDFGTSIHCMDGRIQEPLQRYLKSTYDIRNVDAITEAGPCKVLADNQNRFLINSILERQTISINAHGSGLIAISGHYDCAGNPEKKPKQIQQIQASMLFLREFYPKTEIIGLWVDSAWEVHPVELTEALST